MSEEDDSAILSRRKLFLAGAVGAGGIAHATCSPCLSVRRQTDYQQNPPLARFSLMSRANTPLQRIPPRLAARLQSSGIYVAGGGLTSRPWRCVVDLYGNFYAAEGTQQGGSSLGELERNWNVRLTAAAVEGLVRIADLVWREERNATTHPSADYEEVLLLRDGEEWFFLQGFGPIRRGTAERLVAQMRAIADAHRPATPTAPNGR